MNREDVLAWVKSAYGVQPEYLWARDPSSAVLRNRSGKWFGIIMNVSGRSLGIDTVERVDILNVKCEPELIDSLRTQAGFLPAYHMNKRNWISIMLDSTVTEEMIKNLLEMSYNLTQK